MWCKSTINIIVLDEWKAALVCGMFDAAKDILAGFYEKLRRRDWIPSLSLSLSLLPLSCFFPGLVNRLSFWLKSPSPCISWPSPFVMVLWIPSRASLVTYILLYFFSYNVPYPFPLLWSDSKFYGLLVGSIPEIVSRTPVYKSLVSLSLHLNLVD